MAVFVRGRRNAAAMATPPSVSLHEQQLRFVAAQHLMAVPRTQRPAAPFRALIANAVSPANGTATATTGKRKRGRPPTTTSTKPARASLPLDELQAALPSAYTARKAAYMLQKAQRSQLLEQVEELEQRVERLRLDAGLPTNADRQQIAAAQRRNAQVDEKIHENRRYVLQLQSLVNEQLQSPRVEPLATPIHLPCDQAQRRAILHSLKDMKLRRAAEIGLARFGHLDAHESYLREERFVTDDHAHHCNRWEMNTFPQFPSAKHAFDALLFFIYNMEISVTEMVNQIAVREDSEDIEPTMWNHRIVTTTDDVGCVEELNLVGFAHYYERHELLQGEPLGVITYCSVDDDDLYPYKPAERTSKRGQALFLFRELVDPATRRKIIALQTCLLNAQLQPQFPLEQRVLDKLHAYMSRWIVLMNQYLSEYVVAPEL